MFRDDLRANLVSVYSQMRPLDFQRERLQAKLIAACSHFNAITTYQDGNDDEQRFLCLTCGLADKEIPEARDVTEEEFSMILSQLDIPVWFHQSDRDIILLAEEAATRPQ